MGSFRTLSLKTAKKLPRKQCPDEFHKPNTFLHGKVTLTFTIIIIFLYIRPTIGIEVHTRARAHICIYTDDLIYKTS